MPSESEILRARLDDPTAYGGNSVKYEPTFDGMPLDEFMIREREARAKGTTLLRNDDGTPFDPNNPDKGELFDGPQEDNRIFRDTNTREQIANNYAWNKGQEDALLNGEPNSTEDRAAAYSTGETVQDEFVSFLHSMYNETHLDFGVLQGLEGLPADEQIARITHEYNRLNARQVDSKRHLMIHLMRSGFGSAPKEMAHEVWMSLDTEVLVALADQQRAEQVRQMRREVDRMVAPLGEGFDAMAGVGEIIQQDMIPVYGAVTRVVTTRKFIPEQVEIGTFRGILPGEIRNDIREWLVNASHEERLNYIRDITKEVEAMRKGKNAVHFTRYGVLENVMGIFTEGLLEENISTDTVDRVLGNLDVLLESIYAVGVFAKAGSSLEGLFRAGNASSVRQAARAAGNNEATAQLDEAIRQVADELDISPAEAAVVDLPRPPGLRDDMEVLPDGVKEVIEQSDAIRTGVLNNLDDITGQGLLPSDKANVVRKEIEKLDWGDSVHVNHRMMTVESLPNDTGVRITAVVGETPDNGWRFFDDMIDELIDLDPRLETFEIVRRGANGNVEKVAISADEIAKFVTKGEVPVAIEQYLPPTQASSRLFGGRRLNRVGTDELRQAAAGDLPKQDLENIQMELTRRAGGIDLIDPLRHIDGDEFFLRITHDRYWHTTDKQGFNAESFLNVGSSVSPLLAPNAKFGDDIYGAFTRVYLREQTALRDFNRIYTPYYDLSTKDKLAVQNMFEWAEDFAKSQADRGLARAPTFEEIVTHFDDVTEAQLRGYAAIREGLDLQWELFNRRMYRDMQTRGLVTARAQDPQLPNYHGVNVARESARPGMYFDPVANELKQLDAADVDDLYNAGGGSIRLDFPIDAPGGGKYDRVLVRSGDYEIGSLSRSPLNYYEGYHMRFYEDPVYIVKHTEGVKVNGVATETTHTEAIRTAGSTEEARRFVNKYGNKAVDTKGRFIDNRDPKVTYEIIPAKNINNTEGTLFQQQALYREGRMFWDRRNLERLPDVNGNRAKVEDLTRGLQKGTAMAVRQTTHEDLFNTLKTAFGREYADLINPADLATKDIKTIIADLKAQRRQTTSPELRKRLNTAIETAKYLRIQMGTDSAVVPFIREATISVANWIQRMGGRPGLAVGGWLEKFGQSVDPFRAMRSVAFHTFMVFRPIRQLMLQSFQISYLTALDPTYIGTGRVIKDAIALRRGHYKFGKVDYNDGLSDKKWAAAMGISTKEYKRLVEEFRRSGLIESVDVHAFNPSARKASNVALKDSKLSRGWYAFRGRTQQGIRAFQQGFDQGERNNLSLTYMVALRRALKATDKGIMDLTRKEWDAITVDASNLALAMTRPNKFGYQSGAMGTVTQFLSFGHKAMLGMIGQNPSISAKQGLGIALTTYMLFGANVFGAEDGTREVLAQLGLSRKAESEILPGITLQDILAAGVIESGFNAIMRATNEEWKDLDIGFAAPGANIAQIYENVYEGIAESPEKALLGPFYNPASGFLKGAEFVTTLVQHSDRPPGQKFLKASDALLRNTLPGYNDVNRAMLAYTMGEWLDKDGDKLPLRPTLNTILARGLLGVRSEEELAYYRLQNAAWEDQANVTNAVETNKRFLKELLTGWDGKKYGDEYIYEQVAVLNSLYEQWPEGIRREIFIRSLTEGDPENPSVIEIVAKMAGEGSTELSVIQPWLEIQSDMSDEERMKLLEFTNEVQQGFDGADTEFQKLQMNDRNVE